MLKYICFLIWRKHPGFHFKDLISPVVAEVLDTGNFIDGKQYQLENILNSELKKKLPQPPKVWLTTELGSYPEVMAMMGMKLEIMRTMEGGEAHQIRMMMVEIVDGEDRPTLFWSFTKIAEKMLW